MEYLTLRELLGKKVKKIKSGSELLLLYELYRYTEELLGKVLTIEDASVIKEVVEGEHFSYVYQNSPIELNSYDLDGKRLADYSSTERKYFKGDLSGIVFEKQTDEEWVYSYHTDTSANIVLNGYNRSAGYVSLYAMMLVTYYKKGKKPPKLVLKNLSYTQEEMEYVDILILRDYGNKLLENKVELEYSEDLVIQPEWESYLTYKKQLGFMLEESTRDEKYKYCKKEYAPGDVLLYYQTNKVVKSKSIRELKSCYLGVVRNITEHGLGLTYYTLMETYDTHRYRLKEAESNIETEGFKYTEEDYRLFPESDVVLDYMVTGFGDLFYKEDVYVMPLMDTNEVFTQYIKDKNGEIQEYKMGVIDLVYTVLEDRGVEYNKEKFKKMYFGRKKPMYDKIRV